MPTTGDILGFSNRWYVPGVQNRQMYDLPNGPCVWGFTFPYFFASKLEAYAQRGYLDPIGSRDCEDIVAMVDGRLTAFQELQNCDAEVKAYLTHQIHASFLRNSDLLDLVRAHLLPTAKHQERAPAICRMMRILIE